MASGDGQNLLSVLATAGSAALGAVPNAKAKQNDDALKILAATIQAHQAEQEARTASLRQTLLRINIAKANNALIESNRELNRKPGDEVKELYGALSGLDVPPGSRMSYGGLSLSTPKASTETPWTLGEAHRIANIYDETGILPSGVKAPGDSSKTPKNFVEIITNKYDARMDKWKKGKTEWDTVQSTLNPDNPEPYPFKQPSMDNVFNIYKSYIDRTLGPGASDSVAVELGLAPQAEQPGLSADEILNGGGGFLQSAGMPRSGQANAEPLTAKELEELKALTKKAGL